MIHTPRSLSGRGRFLLSLGIALLLGSASHLRAASVIVTWNKNPESDIAGYKVSYGTQSGVYTTTVDVGNVTTWPVTLTNGQTYYFAYQAYDTSGLISLLSPAVALTLPASIPTPTVTRVAPTSGAAGTLVTVTGTNFGATQGTSAMTFNGTTGTPTKWSATSIVVPVPATATTGTAVVTVSGVASGGVPFTVTPTPRVTTLAPTSGPAGKLVTVTGTNFGATQGTSTVTFNGTTGTATKWSATSLVVTVPAGATTGSAVVTVGGVASAGVTFTVTPTPGVTTLTPTSGPAGTTVTIAGTNFGATQGPSAVTFNGTTGTPTTWSATSISVRVPATATTGAVVVTAGGVASTGVTFTVPSTAPAQMTSPAPGSTLTASTVTFQWTGGTGVTDYQLAVGTTAGGTDLFSQDRGTNLSATVTGLPSTGSTLYARLSSQIAGTLQYHDYTYTATTTPATQGQLTTPAPGSTLTATTVTFQWTGGTGVTDYQLAVGTTVGGTNVFYQDQGANLSVTVAGLPSNGSAVYVRLWSLIGGAWQTTDYHYAATTTAPALGQLTTPAPGSTLTATTVTFQWTGGTGVTDYQLAVGTTLGGTDLFSQDCGVNLSATVAGLPTSGGTVYVRLWSQVGGAEYTTDYHYTTAAAVQAQLTTPAPGSTLTASTVTFQWTGGTGVTDYWLYVGTTAGAKDVINQDCGTSLSGTVAGLPANGGTLYVRLLSQIGGAWQYTDYRYTTTPLSPAAGQLTTPAPGSTLTASTVTFQWTGGTGVTDYQLAVGTTAGGTNVFYQDQGANLSVTVAGLPNNGSTLYVRLWSEIGGTWQYKDYLYTATSTSAAGGQLTTPAPASTLTASTVTFQWTGGTGVTDYQLAVGTTAGGTDLFYQDSGANLSATVAGLPTNGSTLYVRLWSLVNGAWQYSDYTYAAV